MSEPKRIQRKRSRGWRMPAGAVYVGRPSYGANPFIVGETTPDDWNGPFGGVFVRDRAHAVELLRDYLAWRRQKPVGWSSPNGPTFPWENQIRDLLSGKDLACWCPLSEPCHADVLLELAREAQP